MSALDILGEIEEVLKSKGIKLPTICAVQIEEILAQYRLHIAEVCRPKAGTTSDCITEDTGAELCGRVKSIVEYHDAIVNLE